MDITSDLLVALMFVLILGMGIGHVVTTLAALVDRRSALRVHRVHASWAVLLLLVYLSFFWHTIDLFAVTDWGFGGFLYVTTGPILLFFASCVLLPDVGSPEPEDLLDAYFAVSGQFFFILMGLQVWTLGADALLGNGVTAAGGLNLATLVLAGTLARSRSLRLHEIGVGSAWLLFIAGAVLRGLGVLQ
ncbi:MAG: hypothetical protein OEU54_02895 [Gemmatimonadota bacterium]|nr:hypothetical protein [Gemmatimonadota bacterium]